ncbi:DUF4259 domain-containing protein [uncultured Chitinophaga sp.]|uniref:DUF4259 domain-containing protein n=1 Tax=uncultured Chitinophaga sp. TaxID=339340 RepID=UPI0025D2AE43|nr:DUF4259 domain-containing protein [uncultured Chitinophaga sp.]
MWGNEPWDNDLAADWFGGLMDNTNLAVQVREALQIPAPGSPDEYDAASTLRAAASCLVMMGRVYVWPINDLKSDLALGVRALEFVLQDEEYIYNDEIRAAVEEEKKELEERLAQLA